MTTTTLVLLTALSWADPPAPKLLVTLRGHESGCRCVAFSPDGKLLAAGEGGKTVRLWDVATGKEVGVLRGFAGAVWAVAFSPDGTRLAAGSGLLRDIPGGQQTYISGEVKLWDVAKRIQTAHLDAHDKLVGALAFSPDGRSLASGADDGRLKLWDVSRPYPKLLVIAAEPAGPVLRVPPFPDPVNSVAFSPDGKALVWGAAGQVRVWDVEARKVKAALQGPKGSIRCVAFSPDGKRVASATDDGITVWPLGKGGTVTLPPHRQATLAVTFGPAGTTLFSGGNDGTVAEWDLGSGAGRAVVQAFNNAVYSLRVSADGKLLAGGRSDGSVVVWALGPTK